MQKKNVTKIVKKVNKNVKSVTSKNTNKNVVKNTSFWVLVDKTTSKVKGVFDTRVSARAKKSASEKVCKAALVLG